MAEGLSLLGEVDRADDGDENQNGGEFEGQAVLGEELAGDRANFPGAAQGRFVR